MTPRRNSFCTRESQRKHSEFWEYPMEMGEGESNAKWEVRGGLSGKGWDRGCELQITHNPKTSSSLLLLTFPPPPWQVPRDHEETCSPGGALRHTYFCLLVAFFALVRNQIWLQLSPAHSAWQEFLEQPIYSRRERDPHTDTQRHRYTDRHGRTVTHRHTERWTQTRTDGHTQTHTDRHRQTGIDIQTQTCT